MKTERENQSIKLFHKTDMRRKIVRISGILAFIVACVTTVRLIMPAVAMTKTVRHLDCAYEVHTHDDSCYGIVTDEEGNTSEQLICGKADYVLHTHNDDCYEEVTHTEIVDGEEAEVTEWVLTCPLEERAAHFHDDSCYETTVDEEGNEVETLICGELEPHTHTSDCYERGHEGDPGYLICGQLELTEHVHDTDCIYEEDVEVEDAEPAEEEIVGAEDEEELEGSEYSEDFEEGTKIEEGSEAGEEIGEADVDPEFAEENGLAAEDAEAGEEISEDTVDDEAAEETGEAAEETEAGEVVEDTVEAGAGMEETEGSGEKASSEENRKQDVMDETSADENGEADGKDYPEQTFEDATEKVRVSVKAPAGALPAGTTMHVADVDDEETIETIKAAVDEPARISEVSAVDITFKNAAGEEIEPLRPLEVTMESIVPVEGDASVVVHVDDAGKAETVDQTVPAAEAGKSNEESDEGIEEVKDTEAGEESEEDAASEEGVSGEESESAEADNGAIVNKDADGEEDVRGDEVAEETAADTAVKDAVTETNTNEDTDVIKDETSESGAVEAADGTEIASVTFSASEFSVYALVYTVDFHYEVNGKMYEYTFPGGGFVSFYKLVEVLGISNTTNNRENQGENGAISTENTSETEENEGNSDVENLMEVPGINNQDATGEGSSTALTLYDVVVSDATREFVADVESVVFSSPELVWVGKVDEKSTVGGIKEENGLKVQFSADLTEEQIAQINSSTVEAGDWALISMLPFDTEESLTVTMKNGDQFVVWVTDAQISKDYITVLGEKYKITVEYEDNAQIPDGAKLEVKEILPADEKYAEYYQKALEKAAGNEAAGGATLDNYARFFDIEIQVDGQKVEPKASVKVRIELADVPEEKNLAVVHFEESRSIDSTVPVLMDINAEKANDIWFETESFSVYGVITVPEAQPDPAVTDLDGKSFTISHDSRYVTTNITPIENNNNTNGFGKTTSVSQAATWFFEQPEGTSGNTYYIYTLVNDQKQYLNLTKNNNNTDRANASLSLTPQAFTVTNEGSSYRLSTQSNGTTYYLDEHNGNSGNAFAGWHGATNNGLLSLNFSSQPVMQDNGQYMTLVKYNDKYYIVNNDGSLTEVQYDDATKTVEVDDPMLWNVNQNNPNGHIWFNSRETGFEWRQTASDWYRRYLDPSVSGAITEENSSNVNVVYDYTNQDGSVANHIDRNGSRTRALESQTAVNIYDDPNDDKDTYKIYHGAWNAGQNYLGVELDENGVPARLVGQKNISDAAEFVFASPTAVKAPNYLTHTVDHIDVSIEGSANVSIPLAYGNYYGEHGDSEAPIKVVSANTKLELSKDQMVDPSQLKITSDDMKRATITAVRADTGETLDDAFYITGFSGNVHTSLSADQVRIEGSFLVADLRGTEYETIDGGRYSQNATYRNNVRTARLDNKVEYTVTVVKPLTYNLVDPDLGQLYDEDGNAITVTVDVAFSASFDYWDNGNECPAVHYASTDGEAAWRAGGVDSSNLSGMDFVLGGDAENPDSPLVALEITKVIMDEEGNRIELRSPVTNYFDIYEKRNATNNEKNGVTGLHVVDSLNHPEWESDDRDATIHNGYSYWRTKRLTVDDTGSAVVFDFNATDAMYYIVEKHDEESLPEMVTDRSGEEWTYVKTYIETEYVRRDDDAGSHDVAT